MKKNDNKKKVVLAIIKEGFGNETALAKELTLYKTLLETRNIQANVAERMLQETKAAYSRLDSGEVFDAQSQIIRQISITNLNSEDVPTSMREACQTMDVGQGIRIS